MLIKTIGSLYAKIVSPRIFINGTVIYIHTRSPSIKIHWHWLKHHINTIFRNTPCVISPPIASSKSKPMVSQNLYTLTKTINSISTNKINLVFKDLSFKFVNLSTSIYSNSANSPKHNVTFTTNPQIITLKLLQK